MPEKETIILNKTQLKYLLIDSLKRYSEDITYVSGDNPYKFMIHKKIFFIFIHNVHASGRGRTNQDECRIQVNRTNSFLEAKKSGEPVLFFGYLADYDVFTTWNPFILTERINERDVISVYSRFSTQERASRLDISCYIDSNGQVIISFKPEYLGLYLENFIEMHKCTESELLGLIKVADGIPMSDNTESAIVKINGRKYIVNHRQIRSDPSFYINVKKCYAYKCSFCGIQLELVSAAHIIPNAHPDSPQDIKNGLCLCGLHHTAFDNALLYLDLKYNIILNEAKVDYLKKVKRAEGIQKFLKLQYGKLRMPESNLCIPSLDYILKANEIRGITKGSD